MSITCSDLKFFQSQRMTDNTDGGGKMSAVEILSGVENQIFDDLSDVDRAAGDVSVRKVYAAVTSPDTDKYLDAGVVVFQPPADPEVSVLAFSTGSFYDERAAIKSLMEQGISRGARWNGWLWGAHLTGQRAIVLWQRPAATIPSVGKRLDLVAKAASVEQYDQILWITRVQEELITRIDTNGEYLIRQVTCELAEPLRANYTGIEPTRVDPVDGALNALVYDTRYNPEAVAFQSVRPLVADAETGDYSIQVDSLYAPVIPTALSETALPDGNPGGDSPVLIEGNSGTVSFQTTTQCVKPSVGLYLGSSCTPGTLTISVSGSTLTDDNGVMLLAAAEVGTIDYGNGICRWNDSCPNYSTATKTVSFKPAARPLQMVETAAQMVTPENRGYVWVLTLSPIPAPGSLKVAYRVNDQWYVLQDQGGGHLAGTDSSHGSGQLIFSTGTATVTTGALPDVNSTILYAWGTPALYTARGGAAVDAPVVRAQTAHPGVAPNSVTVTWSGGSLTDDGHGALTGTGGAGAIRYATGEWWVRPTTLPAGGGTFTIAYDWGTPYEETFAHPARDGNGHLALTLAHADVVPGTAEVEWNLLVEDYDLITDQPAEMQLFRAVDPIKIVRDDGAGTLPISGGTDGTINYVAGTLDFLPDVTVQIPEADYYVTQIGTSAESGGTKPLYRQTFVGFVYTPAGAYFPIDTSGYVTVRYRTVGGDSSASEQVTLSQLELDLTKDYAETVVSGSVRFTLGGSIYVDVAGRLYRDPSPDTGAGTLCGTIDPVSGRVRISAWTSGGSNAVGLQSLVTSMDVRPVDEVVFRAPTSPLKPGTLQLRFTNLKGEAKSKLVGGSGLLEDTDCKISVDYPLGVVRARFGLWKLDSELTSDQKLEPWYDPDSRVDFGGSLYIWLPKPVLAGSVLYNAVAQTFLPPDSNLLGLDAARMPPDGRALVFNSGRLILVHHTDSIAESNLSPNQVIDCERSRLYRVVIEDADGKRVPAEMYTVNRELGTVTMSPSLDLSGTTAPYAVKHTVGDLSRLVSVDINGTLTLQRPVSHDYPQDESLVSGVMFIGTLQARYTNLFAQTTWDGVWSDTIRGSSPLAQYNDTLYPIQMANLGAYPDRYLIKFTSSSAYQVIGEKLGLIGIGDINTDCTPVNSLTGEDYFTIDHRGWGTGWATGYCVRFNVIAAAWPVDLVRAVQPSQPSGLTDAVELLLIGNVDA